MPALSFIEVVQSGNNTASDTAQSLRKALIMPAGLVRTMVHEASRSLDVQPINPFARLT